MLFLIASKLISKIYFHDFGILFTALTLKLMRLFNLIRESEASSVVEFFLSVVYSIKTPCHDQFPGRTDG